MENIQVFVRTTTWDADDVLGIEFEDVEGGKLPGWEPGAHVGVNLPAGIRHYSLCGDPGDLRRYRIAVLREPASRGGSEFLHEELRPGHMLEITGPANHFALEEATGYRFIAGGIGITPVIPMLSSVRARGVDWSLTYVGRTHFAMAFAEELAAFGDAVALLPRDEKERPDLDDILAAPAEGERVYVCGPPSLVESVLAAATEAGWDPARIHTERFLPVELEDDAEAFTFRKSGDAAAVPVPAEESLVTALERVGVEVESACREGICGTCRIGVVAGEIVHRDAVLSAEERARGDVMMACVSRARGEITLKI
jgi:ferredoxin-NADP reductase